MRSVMPSQVVQVIEDLFPDVVKPNWQVETLNTGHLSTLKGISKLVHGIPDELITVSHDQYADLVLAMTLIDDELAIYRARRDFWNLPRPRNSNVVSTIHRVLKNCPDEFPPSSTTDLDFVDDGDLRDNIRRDIGAVERAISNSEWKAASVLAGAAIEALLLWRLKAIPEVEIDATANKLVVDSVLERPPPKNIEK